MKRRFSKITKLATSLTMLTAIMVLSNNSTAFASTYEIEINNQPVQIETIGSVQVIDINNPLYDMDYSNGELVNGEIVYTAPKEAPSSIGPYSVGSFNFTINNKVSTNYEYNLYSTWRVVTKAHLYNKKTKATYTSDDHYYIVSIMQDYKTPLFSYKARANDVEGGVKFENVPTGTNLAIQVKNETKLPNSDTYLDGYGSTTYR